MADLATLKGWRDALQAARFNGLRSVSYDGRQIDYQSDGEMRTALADLNREIDFAQATTTPRQIRISTSKGLQT